MMTATTAEMLERWTARRNPEQPFDVAAEMSRLTLAIVGRALFGTDLGDAEEEFRGAVAGALDYANHLLTHRITLPIRVPTRANRAGRRAIAEIDRIVWKIIEQRRRTQKDGPDLLGMLINARDEETNLAMDDQQLRDEVVTFLVAGHETTAVSVSWTWHLLAQNPQAEQRLHEEIARTLGDRIPTVDDLPALPYTRMILQESMRLFPPAWAIARQANGDDEIGGCRVAADTTITLSPWVTHRHPDLWDRPDEFDPERFSAERSEGRSEFAYFPFGAGPRRCVGNQFALIEGQLLLAMIAQRFRLRAIPGHTVIPDPILTLRPRGGLPMIGERRH
jgi:cytochrome P450